MSPPRVFITIAERSADQHAANLVRALRRLRPDVMIEGLGGPLLRDAGAVIHFDTVTRAAMGLRALLRAREVSRLLRWTRRHFDTHGPPDLQICCDSWAMNCHFGELAKSRGASVLYYIAPQAWASREGRAKRMQGFVDRLACILPFEEAFFRERGVNATFVGHPLFDELPSAEQRLVDRPARTKSYSQRPPIVGLLAGSRRSVAAANFPRQLEVADAIKVAFPGARFVCPTTAVTDGIVRKIADRRHDLEVKIDAFDELVSRCDLAITVSGTAALQTAAWGVPLVVVYYGNPVLWNLLGRWVVKARTFSLVNILSGQPEHVVPEHIPWYGPTTPVSDYAIALLKHPERLAAQRKQLRQIIATIDRPGASRNVAGMAAELIGRRG